MKVKIVVSEVVPMGYPRPPGEVERPIYSRTIECESSEDIVIRIAQMNGRNLSPMEHKEQA